MKTKECTNCGSTQFHQVKDGWKCEYCGTLYLNPKKNREIHQADEPTVNKKKKILPPIFTIIPIIIMLVGLLGYSMVQTNKRATNYKPIEPGIEKPSDKVEFPGNWTQDIYNSIKVATQIYNGDTEKYSFENGSSYEELEKLVGKPDTVTSWEKESYGMPPRSMATWNKNSDGDHMPHSVTVTYEKDTLMITDKNHY
ncbi:hypothetical protein [Enterococcus pallens]|nr:hypothetical protein [Enterococcus pallens]